MVDRYYRKIESIENEIENSIQISGILLKLKGYDEKLSDLSKIENNENDIGDNKNNITNNQKSINNNKNDIQNNTTSIINNKNDITNNSDSIENNTTSIINNKNNITNNKKSININKNNISYNTYDINVINSYYNLTNIFIYDIDVKNQLVNKEKHFHFFEKEILHTFKKDSYLEIILKVLTELSNYVLIGFFEVLCNFYDDSNNLFYSISLSTAAGSTNKLSTIKSVFMIPINKNTSKIKIDFFIKPKKGNENRSSKFAIIDINSNKIYIKYFQK